MVASYVYSDQYNSLHSKGLNGDSLKTKHNSDANTLYDIVVKTDRNRHLGGQLILGFTAAPLIEAVGGGAKVLAPAVGKTIQQVTQGIKALNGSGVGNEGGNATVVAKPVEVAGSMGGSGAPGSTDKTYLPYTDEIPPRVQSRINIANDQTRFTPIRPRTGKPVSAGFKHVLKGHFGRSLENSRSIFSISPNELKTILQSNNTVQSPVNAIPGGQFVRIVNTGQIVGNTALKFGGNETTWIQIFTDKAGNLITTYPVPAPH